MTLTSDPALLVCLSAALFCAVIAVAVVVLVVRLDRGRRHDPMAEPYGDLPKMPAGSLQ